MQYFQSVIEHCKLQCILHLSQLIQTLILTILTNLPYVTIHKIMLTKESTINFLQNLKLLPLTPKADNDCDQNRRHNWYFSKLDRLTDVKCQHLGLSDISYFTFRIYIPLP